MPTPSTRSTYNTQARQLYTYIKDETYFPLPPHTYNKVQIPLLAKFALYVILSSKTLHFVRWDDGCAFILQKFLNKSLSSA